MMYKAPSFAAALAVIVSLAGPGNAQPELLDATLRGGWKLTNGNQMAAFQLRLQNGWKTYWRAPGDA
jgi:DsbC/DsbD-like thiol-disulfide interchange protein